MATPGRVGALLRAYVRPPQPDDPAWWRTYRWRAEPDPVRAAEEHAAFRAELARAGAEVVVGTAPVPGDPDAIYACDPILVAESGAILLRPGKPERRAEPEALGADLGAAGVPVVGRLEPPATAEGGDLLWLDEHTLAVGRSYRTNDEGIAAIRDLLADVDVLPVDLVHLGGAGEVLHLLSLLSPLDQDLVVAYTPLVPVRLMQELQRRGIGVVEVPDAEFATMGPNVLALGPRIALAIEGNAETRRRMEGAGVEVRTYPGEEISRKGDGGPTCLTLPLARA